MSGRRAHRSAAALPLFCALLLLAACGGPTSGATPRPASAHVVSPTVKPSVVYVAFGASDAVGVGADDPNTQGYVPILITHLPKGSQALNLGVSGFTVRDALTQSLPQAIPLQPTLVTIWLVGNDFRQCTPLDQYAHDLDSLLGQIHSQTHAHVFVANTPDMAELPFFQQGGTGGGACVQGATVQQIHAMAVRWNQTINPIVARHGGVLVDLFNSDLENHPEYVSADGFHPSSKGYAVLANLFWVQITAHHAIPQA